MGLHRGRSREEGSCELSRLHPDPSPVKRGAPSNALVQHDLGLAERLTDCLGKPCALDGDLRGGLVDGGEVLKRQLRSRSAEVSSRR